MVLFSVCVPSGLAVSVCVCVCVLRPFVVGFGCFRGHGCLCVCFCLKRALALSLSVRSHCLCLGLSRFLPSFSHLLSLSLSDLHLSLITFTRKYYLLLCFVLLPLICNNSCILRDATVCVLLLCAVQKREVCPICLPACCVCVRFCLFLWSCDFFFTCNSSIGFVGLLGLLNFFLLLISCSFFFLLCVGVIRGMFQ